MRDAARPDPNSRAAAARLLRRWERTRLFPASLLDALTGDRAFVTELLCGAIRWRAALDWLAGRLVRRPPAAPVAAVLHVGLYQLFFTDRVDAFAAVHETVDAARAAAGEGAARLANAVLRRALREREALREALSRQEPAIAWSHPAGLIERWRRTYGDEGARRLCAWDNERPDRVIRVRPPHGPAARYREVLRAAGMDAEPHPFAPDRFLRVPHGTDIAAWPGFADGAFYVQDPSTALAVDLLDPRPGECILDACAAPGGKTLQIAERVGDAGLVVALDADADRLGRLRRNLDRAGAANVRARGLDAAKPGPWPPRAAADLPAAFDAILLDVPCTSTGTIRRRPDVRWNFSARRLADRVADQRRLLDAAADRLRPGGRIVYSTCSLEPEENNANLAAWLAARPAFRLAAERSLFPPDSGTDGAFAARVERSEESGEARSRG
jgi:16S rRNA (cytosine967-C5)-methyltransferase